MSSTAMSAAAHVWHELIVAVGPEIVVNAA
jgi:hypothetical protein